VLVAYDQGLTVLVLYDHLVHHQQNEFTQGLEFEVLDIVGVTAVRDGDREVGNAVAEFLHQDLAHLLDLILDFVGQRGGVVFERLLPVFPRFVLIL